ncbi:MAG TPA: aldolase/citrate lyase family protein [Magnetospirillaceae bacterium]
MSEAEGLGSGANNGILRRALKFKERLRKKEVVTGAWVSMNDPAVSEIMGRIGFDFLLYDTEHSPWDLETMQMALMALNGTDTMPIVRVPWNDHVRIKQLLDMGVEGILAPMVRTVAECKALVSACRYPPVGARGFGPRRASNYYRDVDAYVAAANDGIFVMPQIEDIATVGVLDEYLAVPGIDAICIGPNDLSGTAGLFRQKDHPTIKGALDTIMTKTAAKGLPICLGVNTPPANMKKEIARGVKLMLVTSDLELLAGGGRAALDAARQAMKA